jgi:hypothetical protein
MEFVRVLNKTKRMEKVKVTIFEPCPDGLGFHEVEIEKYAWKCVTCGLVWNMRRESQNCKHINVYTRLYGGYFVEGKRVGATAIKFYALRREKP